MAFSKVFLTFALFMTKKREKANNRVRERERDGGRYGVQIDGKRHTHTLRTKKIRKCPIIMSFVQINL